MRNVIRAGFLGAFAVSGSAAASSLYVHCEWIVANSFSCEATVINPTDPPYDFVWTGAGVSIPATIIERPVKSIANPVGCFSTPRRVDVSAENTTGGFVSGYTILPVVHC